MIVTVLKIVCWSPDEKKVKVYGPPYEGWVDVKRDGTMQYCIIFGRVYWVGSTHVTMG